MPAANLKLNEVRRRLESNGVSVSDWAQAHGFRREDVYAVLNGRSRCRRGKGHLIAVALGLKHPVAFDRGPEHSEGQEAASGAGHSQESKENAMT